MILKFNHFFITEAIRILTEFEIIITPNPNYL